jgi:hypothetical protein
MVRPFAAATTSALPVATRLEGNRRIERLLSELPVLEPPGRLNASGSSPL